MINDEHEGKRIFGADNTMGLFVALYLILLAFFIVLTSVSNHAASRGAAAMTSVNSTFKREGNADQVNIDPNAVEQPSEDVVLNSVQRSFLSEMELEGRYTEAGGGAFEVQFPESLLFQPGSFRVRQNMIPFLDQLIDALQVANSQDGYEVAFMFGSGAGSVDREVSRAQEIAIRRAGSLARYLQTSGLPRNRYSTGFVGIDEGQVLVVFRRDLEALQRSRLGVGGAP